MDIIKPRLLTEKELKLTSKYYREVRNSINHNFDIRPLIVDGMRLEFMSVERSEDIFKNDKYASIDGLATLVMSNTTEISRGNDIVCKLAYTENDELVYVKLNIMGFIYMMIAAYNHYRKMNSIYGHRLMYAYGYDDLGFIMGGRGFLRYDMAYNSMHHFKEQSTTVNVSQFNVLHTLENSNITYQYDGLSANSMRNIIFANNSTIKIIMNQNVTSELRPNITTDNYCSIIIGNNNTVTTDINYGDELINDSVFIHGDNNTLNYYGYVKYVPIEVKLNIGNENDIIVSGNSNTINIHGLIRKLDTVYGKSTNINIYGNECAYYINAGKDNVLRYVGHELLSTSRENEDGTISDPLYDSEIELVGFDNRDECNISELAWHYGVLLYAINVHNISGYTSAGEFRKFNDFTIVRVYEKSTFEHYYVAYYNGEFAHGYSKKDAVQDLKHRLGLGDISDYSLDIMRDIIESDHITKDDYRELTGACKAGMDMFCNDHDIDGDEMKFSDLMKILTEKNEGYHRIHYMLNKINNTK